jgi:endogenous inhibitor of DNA gyrase (YacG/DUF329 family)
MSASKDDSGQGAAGGRCPICGKPAQHSVRPFCSARCADIDLGRWASGSYVIAGGVADADEDGEDALAKTAGASEPKKGRDDEA